MKNKIISLLLVFAIMFSAFPLSIFSVNVAAAENESSNPWEYLFYSDGVVLTKYNGNATDILIPSTITDNGKDYPVRKLGDDLFYDNDNINSVTLCKGVTSIGDRDFYDADNLVCVLVSEELKYIGNEAFYSCDIMNSIILYDFLLTIGENAFAECPELVVWCNNGSNGYSYVVENNIKYELLNPNATPETYTQDGLTYYIYNGEAHVIGVDDTLTDVEIPSVVIGYPVTSINEAFKNKSKITSVELPNTLKKITDDSFRGCSRITKIIIPDSVTEIGSYAFAESAFTEVVLSRNVKVIEQGTFDYCRQLKNILLPEGLEKIGSTSFVPSTAGLLLSSVVINDFLEGEIK